VDRTSDADVALLSSAASQHLDTDLPLLVGALAQRGITAEVVDWHDADRDWSRLPLVVIRSTWDYTDDAAAFMAALRHIAVATSLANPISAVEGTIDKRYLARLAAAGIPVVPTTVVEVDDEPVVPEGVEVVVKPTVSAGARDTERYPADAHAAAVAHVRSLQAGGRAALVQPYVHAVDDRGETGLVFLGDRFSHAFRKGPILRPGATYVEGLYREEEITARRPSGEEREVAERVLDAVASAAPGCARSDLLYARVDLVPGPDGPLLMELELIEPSLFLETDPTAPARAAAAVAARLGS